MKRVKIIVIIIISVIISSSISAYATYNYFAKDIIYTKMDGTKISVESALNELYNKNSDGKSNKTFVAFYVKRLYSTSYVNIDVKNYNDDMIMDITDDNIITIKESGKYKLIFTTYIGYYSRLYNRVKLFNKF